MSAEFVCAAHGEVLLDRLQQGSEASDATLGLEGGSMNISSATKGFL
jgi:hypothetical protein